MRTRIYNARILTMEENRKIFTGEIRIEDGRIIDKRTLQRADIRSIFMQISAVWEIWALYWKMMPEA